MGKTEDGAVILSQLSCVISSRERDLKALDTLAN